MFTDLKPAIVKKINEFKPISDLHVKVYCKVDGQSIPKPGTFCLGNDDGFRQIKQILDGDSFELVENVYDRNKEHATLIIDDDPSNNNKDNPNALAIDMLTGVEILHKSLQYRKGDTKCVKIYCDNGGSFMNIKSMINS